jgi:DNA-binding transcriptional LysR family regulator
MSHPLRRYLRHGTMPQLAALDATIRLGSFSRAADALCLAKPTITGHIQKLSEALGVRLFELRGKQVVPTPAGLVLHALVSEMFEAIERTESALQAFRPSRSTSARDDQCGTRSSAPM